MSILKSLRRSTMHQWRLQWKSLKLKDLMRHLKDLHFLKANFNSICGIRNHTQTAMTGKNSVKM